MAAAQGGTEEGSLLSVVSLTMAFPSLSSSDDYRRKAVTVLLKVFIINFWKRFLVLFDLVLLSSSLRSPTAALTIPANF